MPEYQSKISAVQRAVMFEASAGASITAALDEARNLASDAGVKLSKCFLRFNDVVVPLDEPNAVDRYLSQCNWRARYAAETDS